ncbi:16S rRNA (guanine(527)-N(7))-methyltransferase RsmG [Sphingomonas sp. CROZ-RG-20F-R02-07]|uniref:16S rRNA (guanine(527)-N(7))-methyltransferase RsmG n=1 Tax=Sphingomonas sp. CROZ-RG-20F-R02-07 TaxID=2914832 RepID=UPI001F5669B8|nr:16S rRNA (guanine(527)-N(7))-methyltransferase RsmG [Sphingomonas sp. CROZ-RG-20F-R02-07]
MTEAEARGLAVTMIGNNAAARVAEFAAMVVTENAAQNLIAPSTIETIWSRHVVDSLQLLPHAEERSGLWIDIGTGGGFPGMIVALVRSAPILLVEPRRRRAEFLESCAAALGLKHVTVVAAKVETVTDRPAAIISARAVASVENLLHAAKRCVTPATRWLLPRGRIDPAELASLQNRGTMFHVEHSITDPESRILVIDGAGA